MILKLKYFLSFLFDIEIETTESILNPFLKVVMRNGSLLLNSQNANYSYGSLQDAFKFVFKKIKIEDKKLNTILILGFGCGSIAALFNDYKNIEITGVEADEKVIELYEKYFIGEITSDITLIEDFAEDFIKLNTKKYDLILVDIFIDLEIPSPIKEIAFFNHVTQSLAKNGVFIYNFIATNEQESKTFISIEALLSKTYSKLETIEYMKHNKIIVASLE